MSVRFKSRRRITDHTGLDDWLMTYADMITLLLCFFAVLLSVSSLKESAFTETREKMMEQFGSDHMLVGKFPASSAPLSQGGGVYDSLPSIVDRFQGSGEHRPQAHDETQPVSETGKNRDIPEGDRITVIEMSSAAFFGSGASDLSAEGQDILSGLVQDQLLPAVEQGYRITVEGHTDDAPISTPRFPSNWELSTARAAAVARFLIGQGIDPQHLSASGYADVFPKAPNRDAAGEPILDNRAQNRRVVIKLEKIERQNDTTTPGEQP